MAPAFPMKASKTRDEAEKSPISRIPGIKEDGGHVATVNFPLLCLRFTEISMRSAAF
jgi:hypothetical protein